MRHPRIHCITNVVAQNFSANVLLALDCIPSMTVSPEEVGSFVTGAQALLINLGTFDAGRREAIMSATEAAARAGIPWVLDPVLVDRSPSRAAFARELLTRRPAVLRLNDAELGVLSGGSASPDAARSYAVHNHVVVALSGEIDVITDGLRVTAISNGHALMTKVTAMGCAASAVVASCLAVEADAVLASTAALTILGIAGEVAGEKAAGPGTFAVAIIDALASIDGPMLASRARLSS